MFTSDSDIEDASDTEDRFLVSARGGRGGIHTSVPVNDERFFVSILGSLGSRVAPGCFSLNPTGLSHVDSPDSWL